jgi:proline iminopeptidase
MKVTTKLVAAALACCALAYAPLAQAQSAASPTEMTTASDAKQAAAKSAAPVAIDYPMHEGWVDARGEMIYYETVGRGAPIVILHGGPGNSHDYFLPYLLPLARRNKLVFIDERGSGRSGKLEDPAGYTLDNMVEDVEAVRQALVLGKITLLGHSFGGVLAQAYALKYQQNLTHLILCSTFPSTAEMNQVFVKIKQNMNPELRARIDSLEKQGLFGRGKDFEKGRYPAEYMEAAWGEGYFPYVYANRPDPNYDPADDGKIAWDVYREMWGSDGEFVIDGNLKSVDYVKQLPSIKVPTLIVVGDHDEVDASLSQQMHEAIAGSELVILPKSGHMTFVDQTSQFNVAVHAFLFPPSSAKK